MLQGCGYRLYGVAVKDLARTCSHIVAGGMFGSS